MAGRDRPLLAVLIDADNVPARYAADILREVSSIGEPALRRVYGDWTSGSLNGWSKVIQELGLQARQETANTLRKNATDIGMVIDAMDILHSRRFEGFVLVSSDSDFTALANRLREDGLTVIGIGERKTPETLRNVCNRFIFVENLGGEAEQRIEKAAEADLNRAFQLLVNAMNKLDNDGDWFHLGRVGQAVQATHPDFDPRSYGHAKLSGLVRAMPKLELRKDGNVTEIRRKV